MADKKKSLPQFPSLLSCIFSLALVVDRSYILVIQTLSTWIPNGYELCVCLCVYVCAHACVARACMHPRRTRVCMCVCVCR